MSPAFTASIGSRQIFGVLVLLFGIALTGYGAYDYRQQSDALENTVETNATITETNVETVDKHRSMEYEPQATFDYRYQGKSYTSNNVFPTGSRPSYEDRSKAESVLAEYDAGETATAYVNPSSPGEAFLENEKSDVPLESLAIGGLTTLVAGVHLFRSSRST